MENKTSPHDDSLKSVLIGVLALYVLNESRKPVSELIEDLLEIEFQAGKLVGHINQLQKNTLQPISLDQTISRVISFVPLNTIK